MSLSPDELRRLQSNSRRAGLISALGGVLVLAAILISAWQVHSLQQRRATLAGENRQLEQQRTRLKAEIATLESTVVAQRDRQERALARVVEGDTRSAERILAQPPATPANAAVGQAPATAAVLEARRVSTPRVYFQIRTADQAAAYGACRPQLAAAGYRVPAVERVSVGPARAEVRYFHAEEVRRAEDLRARVRACLGGEVALVHVGGYPKVNPLHFEVWLPPSFAATGEAPA